MTERSRRAAEVPRLLIVMVLWAGCFPLITLGAGFAPHLAFATVRATLAGLCLVTLGGFLKRPVPRGLQTWLLLAGVGLGATTLGFLGMFQAAGFVTPGIATVIANAQPILAALLAHAFLRERLTVVGRFGLLAGFAGIAAIAWPELTSNGNANYAMGIGYLGLAAVGVATGNIVMKRLTGRVDAIMAMGLQLLLGAGPLALLSLLTEDVSSIQWSTGFILVLVTLSVLGTAVPFWLWFTTLERSTLSRANAFTFLVPVFGLTLGFAFFGEQLVWAQLGGTVLVLSGIALVQRDAPS